MSDIATRLEWQTITLQLRNPFRVSYGVSQTRQAFWLRLAGDEGWGEGTIPPYYGVNDSRMIGYWTAAASRNDPFPNESVDIPAWTGNDAPPPARSALDLALHDRIGRQVNLPLYQLLDLPQPLPLPTAFTIGINDPEEMARQATSIGDYSVIKVKLGSDGDADRLAAIRQARPDAKLYVDANAAWKPREAVDHLEQLLAYDLSLVEQPVAREDVNGMGFVQSHINIPVVADESVQTIADLEALAAAGVRAVNLKLMKLGGLVPTLRLLRRARELGLQVMLGCMIETSLGVTAMAHLAGLADWLDLDAPLLVANDPFEGVIYDSHGRIHLPQRPGIGVIQRPS
jgi:L-alanine-DL-glutamate epimerase-like enolase superfamily enzyme